MDLLQSYDVSSEASGDDEDEKDRFHNAETCVTVEAKVGHSQNVDFFGFSKDDLASSDTDEEKTTLRESLNLTNAELDVPDSEFWTALTSDDLKQAKENSNGLMLTSATDVLHSETVSSSLACADGFMKNKRHLTNLHEVPVKVLKQTIPDHHTAKSDDFTNLPRNIFYVHSKIKPAVHSQQRNRPAVSEECHIAGHEGVTNRVKWNIPQFSHLFLSAGMDSTVKVWNAWSTGSPCVRELRHHGKAVKDAEWSADGHSILSCSYDRCAVLSDVETGKQVCKLDHKLYVTCGKFHPVRRSQVVTGSTNCLLHWDVRTPHTACQEYQYKDDLGQVQDVLFSRDGNQFFTCSDLVTRDSADRNIMAWDYSSGVTLSNQIYQERYSCTRLKLHPSTGHFLAQSHGGYIALFSVNRPYKMVRSKRFEGHKLLGYSIGFDMSRDGSLVYSGSSSGHLHCYDFQTGKLKHSFNTGLGVCMDVSCHPVLPSTLVGCSWGGSIKVVVIGLGLKTTCFVDLRGLCFEVGY